jgi:hypothetical protein
MSKKGPMVEGGVRPGRGPERGVVPVAMHQGPAKKRKERGKKIRGGSVPLELAKPEMDEKRGEYKVRVSLVRS